MLGLTLTPVAMSVGVGVDYSSFKRMENRMVLAAESAMLAGSKKVIAVREQDYADDGDYDLTNAQIVSELDSVFKPHFEANFAAGGYDLGPEQYSLEYIEADNNTKVLVTMNYDTAVMKAFGYDKMVASTEMVINLKVQPNNYVLDIVMCIDATGSMQNTLTAVKNNASTFNTDLRTELGIGENSEKIKIRIRPIFYRDWEEGLVYQNAMVTYNAELANYEAEYEAWETGTGGSGTDWDDVRDDLEDDWDDSGWYYQDSRGRWRSSNRDWKPKTHKRIQYNGSGWLYFTSKDALNDWIDDLEDADFAGTGPGVGDPPTAPVEPINHGLNMYSDFIDLDPNASTGETKTEKNSEFETFLASTSASGGANWPEAAGACLNEAIRSNWYDNQSDEAREYFGINSTDVIIRDNDDVPEQAYSKVTPIPIVVFWSDATINSLQLSRDYLSPTTPTSYASLQALWDGTIPSSDPEDSKGVAANSSGRPIIDQDYKMLIRFGPSNAAGFTTWDAWSRNYYGGSLSTGNSQAVKVIAEKILESIPDLLRVGS